MKSNANSQDMLLAAEGCLQSILSYLSSNLALFESTGINPRPVVLIFIQEAYSSQLYSGIVDLTTSQGLCACDPACQVTAEQEKGEEVCGRHVAPHITAESMYQTGLCQGPFDC